MKYMVGLNSAWRMLRSLLQRWTIGELWATVARGGAGSGRGGERVRLDPPVHSANFFLFMILFQGKGCRLIVAAGPSSGFLSSTTGTNAFFLQCGGSDCPSHSHSCSSPPFQPEHNGSDLMLR